MITLGIDPGLKGAVAAFEGGNFSRALPMPVAEVKRGNKLKHELDLASLANLVYSLTSDTQAQAFVELVNAMPGQGVTSMFSFGKSYGALLGILAAFQIPVTHVTPQAWQKALGQRDGKDGSLLRASELMPAGAEYWTPKRLVLDKEHAIGCAEAALIGYYGVHQ